MEEKKSEGLLGRMTKTLRGRLILVSAFSGVISAAGVIIADNAENAALGAVSAVTGVGFLIFGLSAFMFALGLWAFGEKD